MYIPDSAPNVKLAIQKLHRIASEIHQDNGEWTWSGWLWSAFLGWGWKIGIAIAIIVAMFLGCCLCIQ